MTVRLLIGTPLSWSNFVRWLSDSGFSFFLSDKIISSIISFTAVLENLEMVDALPETWFEKK